MRTQKLKEEVLKCLAMGIEIGEERAEEKKTKSTILWVLTRNDPRQVESQRMELICPRNEEGERRGYILGSGGPTLEPRRPKGTREKFGKVRWDFFS